MLTRSVAMSAMICIMQNVSFERVPKSKTKLEELRIWLNCLGKPPSFYTNFSRRHHFDLTLPFWRTKTSFPKIYTDFKLTVRVKNSSITCALQKTGVDLLGRLRQNVTNLCVLMQSCWLNRPITDNKFNRTIPQVNKWVNKIQYI